MSLLKCNNLTKAYGNYTAIKDINLELTEGKIIGLLGPNGSGKTTLIKCINRLLAPTKGSIEVCGKVPGPETKALISYLPDQNSLPDWMKVRDLIGMYQDFFADFDPKRAYDMLQSLQIDYNVQFKKMSKGTKEKVQLILVMSRRAKLYLLDEPIAGVDPATRDFILNTIINNYDENATVIISTHLISDIENVLDEVIFLKEGNIILHQSADQIRQETNKSIDEYFREVFRC